MNEIKENGRECTPLIIYPPTKSIFVRRILIDAISLISLSIPIIYLYLWGIPFHRGFNCDDDSIRYPYRDNTISSTALYLYSTTIPFVVIAINEYFIIRSRILNIERYEEMPKLIIVYIWQIYCHFVWFAFAALTSQVITDISKYSIGRLRPHFLDRCKPMLSDGTIINRTSKCSDPYTYIINYECSGTATMKEMRDSHLSFMSGHSSFVAVCLIYLVIYIQTRVRWSQLGLLKSLLQGLLVSLVIYTGLSRISDYKHHWSDVLCGLIQGTIVAFLVAMGVSELFEPKTYFDCMKKRVNIDISNRDNGRNDNARHDPEIGL